MVAPALDNQKDLLKTRKIGDLVASKKRGGALGVQERRASWSSVTLRG
jgi:hypothetical protein